MRNGGGFAVNIWGNAHKQHPSHQSLRAAKRGCEEMRIHFFTAPFFVSFFTSGSKKQEEKGILPPFPQKSAFLN